MTAANEELVSALPMEQAVRVAEAVADAERTTSGELKVVLTRYCWGPLLHKGEALFRKHKLHETRERNAVMILVVLKNRELLLFGDRGIDEHVEDGFWVETRDAMLTHLRDGRLADGLIDGIGRIGERLAKHFPAGADNPDELSNEVVYDG